MPRSFLTDEMREKLAPLLPPEMGGMGRPRFSNRLSLRIYVEPVADEDQEDQEEIIPAITPAKAAIVSANEADVLNVAPFGLTAKEWRNANPNLEGNMRECATVEQLLTLANLEGLNSEFIRMGLGQGERLARLNQVAINQMRILTNPAAIKSLSALKGNFGALFASAASRMKRSEGVYRR